MTSKDRLMVLARFIRNQVSLADRPPPGCIQLNNNEALLCAEALEQVTGETSASTADALRDALEMMYDSWENGDTCYEDPESCTGYLGRAFSLSMEEEQRVLALIPKFPSKKRATATLAPPLTDYWRCPCCQNFYCNERLVCPVSGDCRPAEKTT